MPEAEVNIHDVLRTAAYLFCANCIVERPPDEWIPAAAYHLVGALVLLLLGKGNGHDGSNFVLYAALRLWITLPTLWFVLCPAVIAVAYFARIYAMWINYQVDLDPIPAVAA